MVYLYQPLLWLHITTQVVYVADHSVKHHTMIKFVSYLSQVSCFLRLLRFPQRKKGVDNSDLFFVFVSCLVPNVSCVSGLYIIGCPFGFLTFIFQTYFLFPFVLTRLLELNSTP